MAQLLEDRNARFAVTRPLSESSSETPRDAAHADLLAAARAGEPGALQDLLCRYVGSLRTYVRLHGNGTLRAHESCSDLVQSVCRECLQDLRTFTFQNEPAFRKWLFQKAMAKLVERGRYWGAARRSPAREQPAPPDDLPASFATASEVAIRNEDLAALELCFDELPDDYRRVLVAARLLGQSHAEIAAELGRNEGAVRMLLHRALARLGRLMDERLRTR